MTEEKFGGDPMMLGGNVLAHNYKTFGDYEGLGIGSINPAERADVDPEILQKMMTEVAAGAFNVPVSLAYIKWCVDGRTRADGTRELEPNGAGGSLSMVYARAMTPSGLIVLTNDRELSSAIGSDLADKNIEMGVHGDDNSACGCGACNKAQDATGLIVSHAGSVREALADLGVMASDQQHETAITGTTALHENKFFVEDRPSVVNALVDEGAEHEELAQKHNELFVAVNTIAGTTIDRAAIRACYGEQYDLFVLDAWALQSSAELVNKTGYDEETAQLTIAMAYYNTAVAAYLSGPSMALVPVVAA